MDLHLSPPGLVVGDLGLGVVTGDGWYSACMRWVVWRGCRRICPGVCIRRYMGIVCGWGRKCLTLR